ncbi:MAG: hypothetical protein IPN61_06400 [Bacteroidetes bacterium]|nr:hypothetical protein [Bacteroidota bacterium]
MKKYIFSVTFFVLCLTDLFGIESKLITLVKYDQQRFSYYFNDTWKFTNSISSKEELLSSIENNWIELSPKLNYKEGLTNKFRNEGWFRFEFIADSSILNLPLELHIFHYGASEVYLDTFRISKFGKIDGKNTINYFPQSLSNVFIISTPGKHSINVKYANYASSRNWNSFNEGFGGFNLSINEIDRKLNNYDDLNSFSFVLLLGGIFFTLSFFHFSLYIYYKREKSNLFFSLSMFCTGILFIISYIKIASNNPLLILLSNYISPALFCLNGLLLYVFITELFEIKKTWKYWLLIIVGFAITLFQLSRNTFVVELKIALFILTSMLSLFFTLTAIIKKKKERV